MTDDAYRPIDCSLHDRLELLALRTRPVTGAGEEFRLDRLVAVDGIAFGNPDA